jgi:hypothetical protein
MSILTRPESNTITPEMVSKNLISQAKRTFDGMKREYEEGLRRFWKNPNATPQQIATALGADAAELFMAHWVLATAITQADATATLTDVATLGTFTINQDGTVTIDSVL